MSCLTTDFSLLIRSFLSVVNSFADTLQALSGLMTGDVIMGAASPLTRQQGVQGPRRLSPPSALLCRHLVSLGTPVTPQVSRLVCLVVRGPHTSQVFGEFAERDDPLESESNEPAQMQLLTCAANQAMPQENTSFHPLGSTLTSSAFIT